jgi:predicted SprT family Zn-dependent metalloprotease
VTKPLRKPKLTIDQPTSQLYSEFTQAFDYFNERLFDGKLPRVIITLKAKPRSFGHFGKARFVALADSHCTTDEIAMNPTHFRERSVAETLSTLVHEMVHLQQHCFFTPAKAPHHNKEWAQLMKDVGLYPSSTRQPGGRETGNKVSHYIMKGEAFDRACTRLLATGFTLTWGSGEPQVAKSKKQGKRVKYICPACQQACWGKHEGKYICGACFDEGTGIMYAMESVDWSPEEA